MTSCPAHTSSSCFPLVPGVVFCSREGSQIYLNMLVLCTIRVLRLRGFLSYTFWKAVLLYSVLSLSCPVSNRMENMLGEDCCREGPGSRLYAVILVSDFLPLASFLIRE